MIGTLGAIMLGGSIASGLIGTGLQSRARNRATAAQKESDEAALREAREEKGFDRMVYADERADSAGRRGLSQFATQRARRMMVPGGYKGKGSKVISKAKPTKSDIYARTSADQLIRDYNESAPKEEFEPYTTSGGLAVNNPHYQARSNPANWRERGAAGPGISQSQRAGVGNPYAPPLNFASGTDGEFVDFGAGTPAMLHGKEAIVPIGDIKARKRLGMNQNKFQKQSGMPPQGVDPRVAQMRGFEQQMGAGMRGGDPRAGFARQAGLMQQAPGRAAPGGIGQEIARIGQDPRMQARMRNVNQRPEMRNGVWGNPMAQRPMPPQGPYQRQRPMPPRPGPTGPPQPLPPWHHSRGTRGPGQSQRPPFPQYQGQRPMYQGQPMANAASMMQRPRPRPRGPMPPNQYAPDQFVG